MDFLTHEQVQQLIWGYQTTISLFATAWILSFSLGLILTVIRATDFAPCRWLVDAFVEYHRNVPLLVQLFFWYFGMPELLPEAIRFWLYDHGAEFTFAAIGLGLGSSAYVAEDIRSGLRAIPSTQFEATRALGCGYVKSMRYVIVPQALRISLPPLISRTLLLFKNTSIAMAIGVAELTYVTTELVNDTYRTFLFFGIATVLYLVGTFLIMTVGSWLSSKYRLNGEKPNHA